MHKVMVVEDDDDIRKDLAEVLGEEGYAVVEAQDGAEALDRLRSEQAPCVILLDLMMPRMDGWQFREVQRQEPALKNIPTVLLSGAGDLQKHTRELGAAGFISKPFTIDKLLETVALHCQPNRSSCQ